PIPFDAPDGQNVSIIFVLLVPDRATDMHLQILSELAQMFSEKSFREQLLAAPSAAEIHRLITQW
ncbi:MAG TPA: PTS sugar transporter subunit IIA, partial [Burkholderiales bacterium]|nr:PTS sugar transporter subunit IIA [Burkholderiales bacterium]